MPRNAELFNKLADHFERAPETWDQCSWGQATECGTFACIAGWTCILTFGEAAFEKLSAVKDCDCASCSVAPETRMVVRTSYDGLDIYDKAGILLGLESHEAIDLFKGYWLPVHGDLPRAMRALANGASVDEVTA